MWPFRLEILGARIGPTQIFPILGLVACAAVLYRQLRPLGVRFSDLVDLSVAAILGGLAGARLLFALPLWLRGEMTFAGIFRTWSQGSMIYGGYIGGTIAVVLVLLWKRLPLASPGDRIMAALPLAYAVGKVGCFLDGCCFGAVCASPPGVRFPSGSLAWSEQFRLGRIEAATASLPVHPVQLYDAAFGLLLFFILWRLQRRPHRNGTVMLAFVLFYSAYRFFIEFLRRDADRHSFGLGAFSDAQAIAVVLVLICGGCALGYRLTTAGSSAPSSDR